MDNAKHYDDAAGKRWDNLVDKALAALAVAFKLFCPLPSHRVSKLETIGIKL